MKYFKLIAALLIFLLVCAIGYSLIWTSPKANNQEIFTLADTTHIDTFNKVNYISRRDSIVALALNYLGTPYIYGACSKDGFDCSGFVYFVFKNFGIEVPRSSSEYKTFGKIISIYKVNKGDIIVFLSPTRNVIGHLGIVTNPKGMATEFIHSSSGKEMKVILSSLSDVEYKRRFVKAISVL